MKNVLLLCLSPVKNDAQKREYTYRNKAGYDITVSGYTTNEAPAKSVIDGISRVHKAGGEKLDRVVVLCSELVRNPISLDDTSCDLRPGETHVDFFKRQINEFALERDEIYYRNPITYKQVLVDNYTDSNQISVATTDAAREILGATEGNDNEKIRLYIDYNGGQRYFSLMLLALSNLLSHRGVELCKVLAMNYENRIAGKVQIQNLAPIFACMDLTTAINEYTNYGRTRTLNRYFAPCVQSDPQIKELLQMLTDFAHNLLLCRTGAIESGKKLLLEKLENFGKLPRPTTTNPDMEAYRTLFEFVSLDIKSQMQDLLSGSLPEMLRWCVEHDYLQQALTFFTELFPDYMWKNKILQPTPREEKEYLQFREWNREECKRNEQTEKNKYQKLADCHGDFRENSSQYRYDWLIKYLRINVKAAKDTLPGDWLICNQGADSAWVKKRFLKNGALLKRLRELNLREPTYGSKPTPDPKPTYGPVVKILAHYIQGSRVSVAKTVSDEDLAFILIAYFEIKQMRNATNHASTKNGGWNYEDLVKQITACAEELRKLVQ